MENIKNTYAENVKNLRKGMGLTQEEFSEKSEISLSYLKDIERGKSMGTSATLELLAKAFKVPVYRLFMTEKEVLAHGDTFEIFRKIASLGESELEILRDTVETLSKPIKKKSKASNH